jgi:hypothetical protein
MDVLESLRDLCDAWLFFRNYTTADIFHGIRWKQWPKAMADLIAQQQQRGDWILYYHNMWRGANYRDASVAWGRPHGWYMWNYGYDGYATLAAGSVPHMNAPGFQEAVKVLQGPSGKQSICAFLYPRRRDDGCYELLTCKRLEACRDAFQDYMYLLMLDDLIHQAETTRRPHLVSRAHEARAVLDDSLEEIRLHVADYQTYCAAKRRVALEIIGLLKENLKPRLTPEGSIRRHRGYTPEKIYDPQDGGVPHPLSG